MIFFWYRHQNCAFTLPNTQDTVCSNGSHLEIQDGGQKKQITAWQTTYHGSGGPNEYFDTICQLLPKMFSGTFILSFFPLTKT